jgi:hypothetical protein
MKNDQLLICEFMASPQRMFNADMPANLASFEMGRKSGIRLEKTNGIVSCNLFRFLF